MTKIALINPGKNPAFGGNEPLSLGYIASYLEQHGIEVTIIDELAGDDVAAGILAFHPDIVGATATTPLVSEAYAHLAFAREQGYRTVIGGVHASVLPEEAALHADQVVVGEGEEALLRIARGEAADRIVRGTPVKNIDDTPPPARHLMRMDYYAGRHKRMPNAAQYFLSRSTRLGTILASRGCPYSCTFCHNSWKGLPVRYNSPARVMAEIKELKERYHANALFFADDDYFVNKKRLTAICETMIAENMDIAWAANARVSSLDESTVALAKKAGCRQICLGIESGSQRILDVLNKRTTVEQGVNAVRIIKDAGLIAYSTFMIGNPTETKEDIEMTRQFIIKSGLDSIGVCITTPYPGTVLWDWCREHGLVPERCDWSRFNHEGCHVPANENLSPGEIESLRSGIVFECLVLRKPGMLWFYVKNVLLYPRELLDRFISVVTPLLRRSLRGN